MSDLRSFHGPNAGYVLEQYERYQQDPGSVDPAWQEFFAGFTALDALAPPGAPDAQADSGRAAARIETILAAHRLAQAIRARGHTASRLDPLGTDPEVDPALAEETYGLSRADLDALPSSVVRLTGHIAGRTRTAAEAVDALRTVYSGTIGYEFGHLSDPHERRWLREKIESKEMDEPLSTEQKVSVLGRLSQVEGFEKYLHRTFFGQKRFSIEGTDTLVPILDEIIRCAAPSGTRKVLIGMAHRGRLNVLTHVLGKPYELILAGFQGAAKKGSGALAPDDFTGDVKYHMGWEGIHESAAPDVHVSLAPNPSHLEFVNPVVIGMARAAQDNTDERGAPPRDEIAALPVLVHGDAAFPGQGVVPETLNMSRLDGYRVGGTIHVIANNQVGFTTNPSGARSTRYASDLAKGFEIPIVHVNADDVEACLIAARLAAAYRERYRKDFLIDLVGYRRWGHNEGDEPLFTQPRMYDIIRSHPTVREKWAATLVDQGVVSQEEADALLQTVYDELDRVKEGLENSDEQPEGDLSLNGRPRELGLPVESTAVDAARLTGINDALLEWPEGFSPNSRLAKQLQRRRAALGPDGGIDWGHAETLAFGSLLSEGIPVRLTGQDVRRGTFSHRHQVLVDSATDEPFTPLANLPMAKASFEIHNSPLSEMAVVGFEYGYSVSDPQVLVIWEAQFGDFGNGAQVIIDQFIAAAEMKWQQTSGLVMLLPHGYEGQGPEHSSARLERFLQLCAQDNMRVANCTTSAQYFHLLRRQALLLERDPRPLVVMSPKSLLRHPLAASHIEDLSEGAFQPVLGDEEAAGRAAEVTRVVLCSGKVYVDIVGVEEREHAERIAVIRVEELYPFPKEIVKEQLALYPNAQEIIWAQEEPKNMGAWDFISPRLADVTRLPVRYAGRPPRASPAEGYADKHTLEQERIVAEVWSGAPEKPRQRQAKRA